MPLLKNAPGLKQQAQNEFNRIVTLLNAMMPLAIASPLPMNPQIAYQRACDVMSQIAQMDDMDPQLSSWVANMSEGRQQLEVALAALQGAQNQAAPAVQSGTGMGAPPVDLSSFAGNLFNQSVQGVTFRSNVSPDMAYKPGAPGQPATATNTSGGWGETLLSYLQPDMEIDTPAGRVSLAPYGMPTGNYFWPFIIVLGTGIAAVVYFAGKGVFHSIKSRR